MKTLYLALASLWLFSLLFGPDVAFIVLLCCVGFLAGFTYGMNHP